MTYPLVQFVSAPTEGAEVRFDFNEDTWADEETWPEHDGFSLGAPSLEGDPDGVGVEYGFRELSFNLLINAPRQAALARQSALAREILRQTNWLRFQLDEFSRPVWFKTYRTAPGELSFEHVYTERSSDLWGLGVSLVADDFAQGERKSFAVTVANNPAAATNPMSAVLPEIAGDAPTPLSVRLVLSEGQWSIHPMVSTIATDVAPLFLQSSSLTAVTDTDAADTSNAAYSGGSYRRVTFATTPTLAARVSGNLPTVPHGRYKLLVRVARSDTASTFSLQGSFGSITGDTRVFNRAASSSAGHATWVDLGDFSAPYGVGLEAMSTGEDTPVQMGVSLNAARLSGAGNLHIDCFMVIPVAVGTARATTIRLPVPSLMSAGTGAVRIDGPTEQAATLTVGTPDVLGRFISAGEGAFPTATPGGDNRLSLLLNTQTGTPVDTLDNSDSITNTTTVTVDYAPRWLWIGGE